ncbi:TPA: restriction endonuclease subunit S, partial [Escherichia coli]|nr:restriction endonuclease subunit S [Escherichia coli]
MCKRILKSQTSSEGEIPFYKIGTFGKEPDSYISRKLFNEFKEKYSYPKVGEVLI